MAQVVQTCQYFLARFSPRQFAQWQFVINKHFLWNTTLFTRSFPGISPCTHTPHAQAGTGTAPSNAATLTPLNPKAHSHNLLTRAFKFVPEFKATVKAE